MNCLLHGRCMATVLVGIGWAAAAAPGAEPVTLPAAAGTVVDAIREAAEENARLPAGMRKKGDELAEYYFRRAASAADQLPHGTATRAYLIGLAIGLDDSNALVENRLLGRMLVGIESPEARGRRVAALGGPTMRGRNDLVKHFAVSAGLAAMSSPESAEAAGIFKEVRDSQGGSGFSFGDYAADLAGISFAEQVIDGRLKLDELGQGFAVGRYMPSLDDLPEGLAQTAFLNQYGSPEDERFRRLREAIRKRIADLAPAD